MSTRHEGNLDVRVVEPPTRLLSARELREQLGASGALGCDDRDVLTRPLSRVELEREIAQAEAAATDAADEAETRWLPRSLVARQSDPSATRLQYALPWSGVPSASVHDAVTRLEHASSKPVATASASHDVTVTSLEAGVFRADVPRLGARQLAPSRVTAAPAAPAADFEPREPTRDGRLALQGVRSFVKGRRRWAALMGSLALLLAAVRLGASPPESHKVPRPARAATPATSMALTPAPAPAPTPAAPLPPGSPRRALDLLLGGQRERALDAYQALAHERPSERVYAQLVELLEREVRSCAEAGPCP